MTADKNQETSHCFWEVVYHRMPAETLLDKHIPLMLLFIFSSLPICIHYFVGVVILVGKKMQFAIFDKKIILFKTALLLYGHILNFFWGGRCLVEFSTTCKIIL